MNLIFRFNYPSTCPTLTTVSFPKVPAMPSFVLPVFVSLGLVVCWSSGFIGTQMASDTAMPATVVFFWRFILAASLCALILVVRSRVFRHRLATTRQSIVRELAAGSFSVGGYLLGVVFAMDLGVGAGITALITALQPLLAALVMSVLVGERISLLGWFGASLAAVGVSVSVAGDIHGIGGAPLWAYALPCASAISLTVGSILSTYRPANLDLIQRLMWQLLAAAVLFGLAGMIKTNHLPALPRADLDVWRALVFLVVLSSFGGYGFFIACLRLQGVTLTSMLFYLTPPATMLWAAVQLGDGVSTSGIVGGLIAAVGVALALRALLWPRSGRESSPTESSDSSGGAVLPDEKAPLDGTRKCIPSGGVAR
ncbi:DMT family transporter [Salinisphaera aquimarina]|uniref:DMT family transporter n=1 Tax=Salinisphaera aquimarina TaxID=2094031 RepID=A0ABV7ELA7_9GAMM